ncbi:MAG TPA: ectonucleotide pyrophosphatase/phosphodiesterase [Xanthomonadaceae bacterium]|nr:ectonucleotide pyrophosphatase/phosphodiesterase [Xanthomonadaceae bacterium]
MPTRCLRSLLPALLACLAACASVAPPPAAPPVLLVSIDGLRADVVGRGEMPTLDALARRGVWARWMNPSYPALTFPNHYTLVTGLRPDHHGIVQNTMRDPVLGTFSLHDRDAVGDPRWWGGEPLWTTLRRHGGRAATMFWPGSEAAIGGAHPDYWRPFDATVTPAQRVDQVLAWLDLPRARRPRFLTLYFNQVDSAEHATGVASPETRAAQSAVDVALARLLRGLEARGMRERINLVVVSDHGMAEIPDGQRVPLADLLHDAGLADSDVDVVTAGQVIGLAARPGHEAAVDAHLPGRHPHATCWRKAELPARWHYGRHPRIPPYVCQADVGWRYLAPEDDADDWSARGAHGYAPEAPEMRAVFVADGPAFRNGVRLPPFDNVDVYPLLARLLRIAPAPNDGDARTFDVVLTDGGGAAGP